MELGKYVVGLEGGIRRERERKGEETYRTLGTPDLQADRGPRRTPLAT